MMDSQEKTLEQAKEELNVAAVADNAQAECAEPVKEPAGEKAVEPITEKAVEPVAEEAAQAATADEKLADVAEEKPRKVYANKKEVVERIKEIAHSDENPQKDEIDYLKTVFYKMHFAEREADQKAFIEGGGNPAEYKALPDEDEESFKAEMIIIKEKRAKIFMQTEQEKLDNMKRKLEIIEKIKAMLTSPEEANKSYQDFKKLQQEWKEIKLIPADKANELWRNYQLYVEQYYDLLKLNSEAREYDFKKNLEIKNQLCEAAEKLVDEPDVISAFHQLQKLHQEYRETGPVAKELREELWARFKAASAVINKRHQKHFEELRAKEEDNLTQKTALCEKLEAVAAGEHKNASEWEKATKEIIAIQAEWKTIGFAPQKMNVKIFERFRSACDTFFSQKAEFFKGLKEKFAENAEKKKALVEQAQALQDSTDWKATSDKLIALQKEWKTIGMVPKRQGDKLWSDFLAACNHFFEARNSTGAGTRGEERENMAKKLKIIEQLKALTDNAADATQDKVRELVDQYNEIGHVPFKNKDKVYKEFHDTVDTLYKQLNISTSRRRLDKFKSNLKSVAEKGVDALDNERGRLMRRYEQLRQEIQTYDNNLGFLNASSKKGNSLIDELNKKVQKLKDDMALVKEKIKAIDAENEAQ